jgi:hypothetical protein
MYCRYSVTTSKQHALLGNRFLISKYTQSLLGNAFANKHVLTETEYNNERCFLRGLCRNVITETSLEVSQLAVSCKGVCEEFLLVEAVTRVRLIQTHQTEKT